MTWLLAIPLLPAAAVSVALALVAPGGAGLPALMVAASCAALAGASADRARRTLWLALSVTLALTEAARILPPPGGLFPDPLAGARASLAATLLRLIPDPEGAVVVGIVLGERAALDRDLAEAFMRSGTAHLLAVSGFNMTLVASAVALGWRGRLAPRALALATAAALAAYALLVGPSPSVLRAGAMALVASLGLALGRTSFGANALCLAVALLVALEPANATSVGFQLSVAATAGLLLWQTPLAERLSRLPSVAAEGLATTLAASLPTVPILAAAFGRISLVSPAANLIAVPLFAPLLALGMATALIGAIAEDVARPLGLAAFAVASAMRRSVELAASVPGASLDVPRGPLSAVACAAAALLLYVVWRRWRPSLPGLPTLPAIALPRPRKRSLVTAVVASLVLLITLGTLGAAPQGDRLRALDVGQGDAYLVEMGGAVILVDGGPDPARLLGLIGGALPPWQRRIDLLVLTHAHADHGAGLLGLIGRYEIGLAIEPRGLNEVALSAMWRQRLDDAGVRRRAVGSGERLRVGNALVEVLSPRAERQVNVPGLVLRVSHAGLSALFTGDATDDALADLLLDRGSLRAAVYVPPHHGADTRYAVGLVAAVRPRVALLSVGASNRYGHPTPATLAALRGVATYRTDRHGTVEVRADGSRLLVHTSKAGVPAAGRRPLPDAAAPGRARLGTGGRRAHGDRGSRALAVA